MNIREIIQMIVAASSTLLIILILTNTIVYFFAKIHFLKLYKEKGEAKAKKYLYDEKIRFGTISTILYCFGINIAYRRFVSHHYC